MATTKIVRVFWTNFLAVGRQSRACTHSLLHTCCGWLPNDWEGVYVLSSVHSSAIRAIFNSGVVVPCSMVSFGFTSEISDSGDSEGSFGIVLLRIYFV